MPQPGDPRQTGEEEERAEAIENNENFVAEHIVLGLQKRAYGLADSAMSWFERFKSRAKTKRSESDD